MKVSIITVSYNSVQTIEKTILSVLNQSYSDIEYIIIDGQSTDGTQSIIEKYIDSLAYYVSEPDQGLYNAMNKGIDKATGEIIGIINSDDWYEKEAVEKVINKFRNTRSEIVYGKVRNIYYDGTESFSKKYTLDELRREMVIHHPGVFVKKNVYQKYGLFDERYKITADYDFLLRVYLQGVKFVFIDEVIANFRYGRGITSLKRMECAEEMKAVSMSYVNEYIDKEDMIKKIERCYHRKIFVQKFVDNSDEIGKLLKQIFPRITSGVVVWGTGMWGHNICSMLDKCNIPLLFCVDSDKKKWGQKLGSVEIKSPQVLLEGEANILIAVRNQGEEIGNQLKMYDNGELTWISVDEMIEQFGGQE